MGWVHYLRQGSRARIVAGDTPKWISNRPRHKYIAQIVLSMPPWLSLEQKREIMAMHRQAALLTLATGILHVLDHIVPITHPRVCGLSVPWNLQVVTWRVNASKGNKWNPDQTELF